MNPRRRVRAIALPCAEFLECRALLALASIDIGTTYQTIDGYGTHMNADSSLADPNLRNAYRDAGFNMVRLEVGPQLYTFNKGGDLSIPIPIDANYSANIARFNFEHGGWSHLDDFVKWVKQNAMEPDRFKLTGAVWSPPHWLKIATGTLINWTNWDGTPRSNYGPFFPYGVTGGNTGGGRVDPARYQEMARWVLSFVKGYGDFVGIPLDSFSFQNEPDYEGFYNTATYGRRAVDLNDLSQGGITDWTIYANAFQAIVDELALNPDIKTRMIGPEIMTVAPWADGNSNAVRQSLVNASLMDDLDIVGAHGYESVADSARGWDRFYNRYKTDGKPIYVTEHSGENQNWMDGADNVGNGALGLALKIHNAFTYGHASTFEYWSFSNNTIGSSLVQPANRANPTADFKYNAMIHFSRFIRPGAVRIGATFENGLTAIGGADALDSQNALNVSSYFHPLDKQLTTVLVNMRGAPESTTISFPAGMNLSTLRVYRTSGSEKFVQQPDVTVSNGQVTVNLPAYSVVTVQGTSGIPAGWTSAGVGSPTLSGWARQARGAWTVMGGGTDIGGTSDQFHFASKSLSGNAFISASIDSMRETATSAEAGVMLRASAAANAPFAALMRSANGQVSFQYRTAAGGAAQTSIAVGDAASTKFVRVVRSGNAFSGFYSANGTTWTQVGSAVTISMPMSMLGGIAVSSRNGSQVCAAQFSSVATTSGPVFEVAANAVANPVTTTRTTLSALAIDDGGDANLSYAWAVVGTPPAAVTFDAAGSAVSVATFTQSGAYTFRVTATDSAGNSSISDVSVNVVTSVNALSLSPVPMPRRIGLNDSIDFSASATDQFGRPMSVTPTWSLTGDGSLSSTGAYRPPAIAGSAIVQAAVGAVTRSVTLAILPYRSVREAEIGAFGGGATTGTANGGYFGSSYVDFPGNGGFLQWTNVDGGLGGTTLIDIRYALGATTARTGRLIVNGVAQNITFPPTGAWNTWANLRMNLTLNAGKTNSVRIESIGQDLSNIDEMYLLNATPVVSTNASASPSPVTGVSTTLGVTGNDDLGADRLIYIWATTGTPPAPVTFSVNGSNAARSTVVTFTRAGTYTFVVTAADPLGASTSSNTTVTVNATLSSLSITPPARTLTRGSTQQYAAVASDQFGNAMLTPSLTWTTTGGAINAAGFLTVGSSPGNHVVQAAAGGVSATANYTVPLWSPGSIALASVSDTGGSNQDRLTRLNNSAVAQALQFEVSDVAVGATVELVYAGLVIGSSIAAATTVVVATRGDSPIAEGPAVIQVRQVMPGMATPPMVQTTITIDTVSPRVHVAPTFSRAGNVHTLSLAFSEDVGATVDPSDAILTRTVGVAGGAAPGRVLLGVDSLRYDMQSFGLVVSVPQLPHARLPEGRYQLDFDTAGISDLAGNALQDPLPYVFQELAGDANDDGSVDFADLLSLAAHYNSVSADWSQGDFNYDDTVDFDDLLLLAGRYNMTLVAVPSLLSAPSSMPSDRDDQPPEVLS
jgi:O-glycosyl hydrolase